MRGERTAETRLALRIAARSSRRSLGRSALIAAMVALPVAALAGIGVVYDSARMPTVDETIATVLGDAEAELMVAAPPNSGIEQDPHSHMFTTTGSAPVTNTRVDPADVLPPGTEILTLTPASVTATTAAGRATFDALEGESWHPALSGRFDLVDGRVPRADDEAMVTASLLPRLGIAVGGTVELTSPTPMTVTVVGILDDQSRPDAHEQFFLRNGAVTGQGNAVGYSTSFFVTELELTWDDVRDLNAEGITAVSRDVLLHGPPAVDLVNSGGGILATAAIVAMFCSFAAFEVILLAGAAFTVTARQQQRMLATIASVGAPRRLLFRILAANGIVLGALGGVLGCLVGVGAAVAYMAVTADGSSTQYYGVHIPWLVLLGCVAFAVLIGWIASLAPARAASRFDLVAALRGARRPPVADRRRPTVGLGMIVTGLALTVGGGILLAALVEAGRGMGDGHPLLWLPIAMMIVGPILVQLGLTLCGPLLLSGIARVFAHSGIGSRLASRDVARNPGRAVPALAAIMTTVFVAVVAMCLISAGEENSRREHNYTAVLGQVRVDLRYLESSSTTSTWEVGQVDDPTAVVDILRTELDTDDVRVLSNVADPFETGYDDTGEPIIADAEIAMPVVPAANLCPLNARSPEFEQTVANSNTPAFYALSDDERCRQPFLDTLGGTNGHLFVGDAGDLALVLGRAPSTQAVEALANGGAVALYAQYVEDDRFTVSWWNAADALGISYGHDPGRPLRSETLDAVVDLPEHTVDYGVFVSRATADAIGLDYGPAVVVASPAEPPTRDQTDALEAALSALPGPESGTIYARTEAGPPQYAAIWAWGLLALAAIIALASAAVAIGLARFDGRQDDATLASLGAAPRVRRSFAFWQALIITGVGTLVGTAIALVPSYAISANPHMPFMPPWLQIALLVAALPAIISAGSWVLARRSRVSARRLTVG